MLGDVRVKTETNLLFMERKSVYILKDPVKNIYHVIQLYRSRDDFETEKSVSGVIRQSKYGDGPQWWRTILDTIHSTPTVRCHRTSRLTSRRTTMLPRRRNSSGYHWESSLLFNPSVSQRVNRIERMSQDFSYRHEDTKCHKNHLNEFKNESQVD